MAKNAGMRAIAKEEKRLEKERKRRIELANKMLIPVGKKTMETLGLISFDPNGVFRFSQNRWIRVFKAEGNISQLAGIALDLSGRIRIVWHVGEDGGRDTCHLSLIETGEIYEEVRQLMSRDEESIKEAVRLTPLSVDEVMNHISEMFGQSIRFSYASYVRGNKDWKKECFLEVEEEVNKFRVGRCYGEAFSALAYPSILKDGFADKLKDLGCQMFVCLDLNSLTAQEQMDFSRAIEKRYNRRLPVVAEEDYLNVSYSLVVLCDSDDARDIIEKTIISLANGYDFMLSSSFYEQKKVAESVFSLGLLDSKIMRTTIENGYLEMKFNILANGITLVGALVMMIGYSPIMTVVACLFFVLPIGVSYITGNRIEKVERTISEKNSELVATLKDSLSGFSVIKSFKAENAISELFTKSNNAVEQAKCNKRKLVTVIGGLAGVAGVTAQLGTFLVGAFLALSGWGITPGILIVFIDLTANVINPIRELPEQLASRKAAIALIDKLADSLKDNVRDEGSPLPMELNHGIDIRDVTFGYEAECDILHNINTTFVAGKKYAIVGASGSGKSTLLNLLMASHGNYSGQICYDDHEVKDINSESLYDIVSMIQQNVFVFNGSIRDNITMFQEFSKAEIDRAIELSGLSKLITARGEDYLCGENGCGLSGGEKQRISIARSLLKRSQVLLVDEATAALDAETAYQVSSAILGLADITSIVVTHSLDERLLKQYDGIITLKNGSIVETGTFDELIAEKGYFYSLFTISQ